MAKGFKRGAGGANPLNFKVVGNPQPANPKENTIWVDSDSQISGYLFSATNPNLLDFSYWANNVSIYNGTKTVSGNSITLNSSKSDCYTQYNSNILTIPCVPGKTYVLEWEHSGSDGKVYIFPKGGTAGGASASATVKRLECTMAEGVTFFTFRFGVSASNATATYSNIRITEKERTFDPGAVWISTGTSSPAAFNALKKNNIQVYPNGAMQYIAGAWVNKTAKIYQGSAWLDLFTYLYNAGIVNTNLIGKWTSVGKNYDSGVNGALAPTVTDSGGIMTITIPTDHKNGMVYTNKKINLTEYKTLCFDGSMVSSNGPTLCGFGVWSSIGTYMMDNRKAWYGADGTDGIKRLDISALSGEHNIGFYIYSSGNVSKIQMRRMWLER